MQALSFSLIVLPALILAIALSAPRFLSTFSPRTLAQSTPPPASVAASAICLSALALSVADHGPLPGAMIALTGLLLAQAGRISKGVLPAIFSAVSLAVYLQIRSISV